VGALSGRAVPHRLTADQRWPWPVERATATVTGLLQPWPSPEHQAGPVARLGGVSGGRAIVLGSTQPRQVVDEAAAAAAGVDVVRRSTGGGAVLVAGQAQVWLDLWVPRQHDLWDDDIVTAAHWVGEAWRRALIELGAVDLRVHAGGVSRSPLSDLVCFAGIGPGEVLCGAAKIVGLAQRRTRAGARFHTTAPLRWNPRPLIDLLDVTALRAAGSGVASLDDAAVGLRDIGLGDDTALGPVPDTDLLSVVENAVIDALP
jgi:lipoate---protein ligase